MKNFRKLCDMIEVEFVMFCYGYVYFAISFEAWLNSMRSTKHDVYIHNGFWYSLEN